MALLDDAKNALGELFIIGFSGLELSDETAAFLSQAKIGGTILFAHNYEAPSQVGELANQIQECRSELPLWISVDHEGGRVQRFKNGFTRIPDALTLSKIQSTTTVFNVSEMIAKELKAVGMNINYCPVADINSNPKNPVIGARAFGDQEEQVSRMVTAMVRGHLMAGVQPCVKHFPGHGDTSTDSHFALPRVDTDLATLTEREFKPFIKAFKSRCNMVMTAHVLTANLDPNYPATLSKIILQDILRKEMRFNQLIISDDLEMKAITDHYGVEESPRLAIQAGCDLLIYRSEGAGRQAYEALIKALDQGTLAPETVLTAAQRSMDLKRECLLPYAPVEITEISKRVGTPENLALLESALESAH
jgi:beta-N-acetylhexosaminidase